MLRGSRMAASGFPNSADRSFALGADRETPSRAAITFAAASADARNPTGVRDVVQRIRVEHKEVGILARGDHAKLIDPEEFLHHALHLDVGAPSEIGWRRVVFKKKACPHVGAEHEPDLPGRAPPFVFEDGPRPPLGDQ